MESEIHGLFEIDDYNINFNCKRTSNTPEQVFLKKVTLQKKVEAWMGMREKAREAIHGHRNQVNTAIQGSIVTGKYCYNDFKKIFS